MIGFLQRCLRRLSDRCPGRLEMSRFFARSIRLDGDQLLRSLVMMEKSCSFPFPLSRRRRARSRDGGNGGGFCLL